MRQHLKRTCRTVSFVGVQLDLALSLSFLYKVLTSRYVVSVRRDDVLLLKRCMVSLVFLEAWYLLSGARGGFRPSPSSNEF